MHNVIVSWYMDEIDSAPETPPCGLAVVMRDTYKLMAQNIEQQDQETSQQLRNTGPE